MCTRADLTQLSLTEQTQQVQYLRDSIAAAGNLPLTPELQTELKWRLANPSEATFTWDEVQRRATAQCT